MIFGAMPMKKPSLDRALAVEPNDVQAKVMRAFVDIGVES